MRLSRRSMLRASGLAAGVTLAGCTGVFGEAPGHPRHWQFDTAVVSETSNLFFGTVDHARLYEGREHLPAPVRETVETAAYTPIDAGAIEAMAAVGGVQFGDYGGGSSVTFGSVATLGSFDRGAIKEKVVTEGDPETERDYRGSTLYEGVDGQGADGLEGVPGDDTPFTMAAVAVDDGAVVVGSVAVRGRNAGMVVAANVVEAAIDAAAGEGPRLHGADSRVRRLAEVTGESTVTAGARADPALLGRYRQADGPIGEVATGLQAGGIGVTVDGATAEMTLAGLYGDAATAEATDAVALVEGFAADRGDRAAVENVEATYDGEAVVVTVTGETRALLDGETIAPPSGSG